MCKEKGIFVFEVSYLKDVIENTYFDTIYHEHLDYHTLIPLKGLLERSGFEIINSICINTHGGSLRVICKLKGANYPINNSVELLIENEKKLGLDSLKHIKISQKILMIKVKT